MESKQTMNSKLNRKELEMKELIRLLESEASELRRNLE